MSTALWVTLGIWGGCLVAEAFDDFRGTRGLVRELRRQLRWARGRVGLR